MITYMTFLMHKKAGASGGTYEKLVDIKEFPDMGGEPELIDITTLSDKMERKEPGIQKSDAKKFTCNYDEDTYDKLVALEDKEEEYALWLGGTEGDNGEVTPTGDKGKWEWKGMLSCYLVGKGTNEAHEISITITNTSVINKKKKGS